MNQYKLNKIIKESIQEVINRENSPIEKDEILLGKNGMKIIYKFGKSRGITNELIKIGEDIEELSKKYFITLSEPYFDSLNNKYSFEVLALKTDEYGNYVNENLEEKIGDLRNFKEKAKVYLKAGTPKNAIIGLLTGLLVLSSGETIKLKSALNDAEREISSQKNRIEYFEKKLKQVKQNPNENWKLAANDVIATVYNAEENQCNADYTTTASNFKLNMKNIDSHRIIAMERTFMKELGLKYGDVVKIEGTGRLDGVYQIQDTMNKRFAGKHKIDILRDNDRFGQWKNVKLYVLEDKDEFTNYFKNKMLGSKKK